MLDETIVLIPSLDPNEKLVRTVMSLINAGFTSIVLVNDGSKKENLWPFEQLSEHPEVSYIGYENNQGKGYALKYGFKYILENYPYAKGVLTCDGDGQHLAEDCIRTALAMRERDEVVLGCRNFRDKSVPTHNKLGNTISIFAYNYICGIKLSDTQTGLRAIPVRYLSPLCDVPGMRFEYETNMLIYFNDNNIKFSEVEIATVYEEDSNKGSHFRVVSDSIKIYKPLLKNGGPRFLKFLCASGASAVLDLGIFTLIGLFWNSIWGATAIARVCSSLFNFFVNRGVVFRNSSKGCMLRYYALAVCQLCASALFVSIFCRLFAAVGFGKTVIKFIVDMILFFISFKIQREWVFK